MKKFICIIMAAGILFAMAGCAKTKVLHCDSCKKEVTVREDSNMEESWIIYCEECNEKLFGDDPILGNGSKK